MAPSISKIIKNLERIPELRKIIKCRESFYAFLSDKTEKDAKYIHLVKLFKKENVVTMFEAKEYLNVLLERILSRNYNFISYDKNETNILVEKISPEDILIIDSTTIAFSSKQDLHSILGKKPTNIKQLSKNSETPFFDVCKISLSVFAFFFCFFLIFYNLSFFYI